MNTVIRVGPDRKLFFFSGKRRGTFLCLKGNDKMDMGLGKTYFFHQSSHRIYRFLPLFLRRSIFLHEVFLFLGPKKSNIFHPQKSSGLYLYYLQLFFGFKSSPSPVGAAAMSYGSPSSRVAEGSPAGQRRAGRVAEGSPSARHLSLGQLHGELARLEELAQELRGEIAARWRLETKGDLVSMFLVVVFFLVGLPRN